MEVSLYGTEHTYVQDPSNQSLSFPCGGQGHHFLPYLIRGLTLWSALGAKQGFTGWWVGKILSRGGGGGGVVSIKRPLPARF